MEPKYWTGTPPERCQICDGPITDTFIDGKIRGSSWAYMCPCCHNEQGVGLGVGKGQKYAKGEDGKFMKIGG